MESSTARRVLILAARTATSPELREAVRERAAQGPAAFTLVVPAPAQALERLADPGDITYDAGQRVLDEALPILREAAGGAPVDGQVGDPSPLSALQDAVNLQGFDEVIVSTLPHHLSKWLHLDLPSKAKGLGLPLTTVTARHGNADG